jgi:hypothetical protein
MKNKQFPTLLASILAIALSSAQSTFGGSLARGSATLPQLFIDLFGPFFTILLGGQDGLLFEKVLLFLIITSLIYMVVKNMAIFGNNNAIITIVTFSISILSTRFMSGSDLIYTILLPYGVLGVSLSAFLPLVIAFAFIYSGKDGKSNIDSGFMRRIFWILFTVIFFAMWSIRYEDVGGVSWIYFWSAVFSFLLFLFDGSIRRAIVKARYEQIGLKGDRMQIALINEEIGLWQKRERDGYADPALVKEHVKLLEKQKEDIIKVKNK